MYLFFDTETTGLPKSYNALPEEVDNWPRMVQLAWLLYNEKGKEVQSKNFIIKPHGFQIPTEATRIHGITTELAQKKGVEIAKALKEFSASTQKSELLVAHNIAFDLPILKAEYLRTKIENNLLMPAKFCTMISTIEFCRIPRWNGGYKWPKLSELHAKLFGKELKNGHNAFIDAKATAKCFFELQRRGVIPAISSTQTI